MLIVSTALAVLAAGSNATGTVLQRRAALVVPSSRGLRLGLMWDLLRTPAWLLGIVCVILAAVLQGAALATGPLSLVQPFFVLELPLALLIGQMVLRRRLPGSAWASVAAIVVGLGIALASASPTSDRSQAPLVPWLVTLGCCGGAMALLSLAGLRRAQGPARASCMGLAAAVGYALTAALMKSATDILHHEGALGFFTAWQTYAFAGAGVCALFLLENTMQAGPLVASQPALTLGDTLVSVSLGVGLFGEKVRAAWWLLPTLSGLALMLAGVITLSRFEALPRPAATDPPERARVTP